MGNPLLTTDQFSLPPPIKGASRRKSPWPLLLFLLLCVAGMWLWMNRDRYRTPELSGAETESADSGESIVPLQPTGSEPEEPPNSPSTPPQPGILPTSPATDAPRATGAEPSAQPPVTEMRPTAVTAVPVPRQPLPPVASSEPPSAGLPKMPIAVQLLAVDGSLQMLIGVPQDEQLQALRQASSSHAEVEVRVAMSHGEATSLGRARLAQLIGDSRQNASLLLEFIQMLEMETLVKLTNARLSPEAKLVIILDEGHEVEYPFSTGAGALEGKR